MYEIEYSDQQEGAAVKPFRPGLAPTVVVLLLLPVLVSLGFWQLGRGAEKTRLLAEWDARRLAEPVAASQLLLLAEPGYRRVLLRGEFDAEHSVLLDNRTRDGQVGVELLQPFHDQASGQWLLLNRGWLPWPDRRTPPAFDTPHQPVNVQAWVYVPPGATFQLQADASQPGWPELVTAVQPEAVWAQLGRDGYAHELRLEPGPAAYRLEWPLVSISPEKHLGYAVQWFAMSLTLVVLYLYLGWHDNNKEKIHGSSPHPTRHP